MLRNLIRTAIAGAIGLTIGNFLGEAIGDTSQWNVAAKDSFFQIWAVGCVVGLTALFGYRDVKNLFKVAGAMAIGFTASNFFWTLVFGTYQWSRAARDSYLQVWAIALVVGLTALFTLLDERRAQQSKPQQ